MHPMFWSDGLEYWGMLRCTSCHPLYIPFATFFIVLGSVLGLYDHQNRDPDIFEYYAHIGPDLMPQQSNFGQILSSNDHETWQTSSPISNDFDLPSTNLDKSLQQDGFRGRHINHHHPFLLGVGTSTQRNEQGDLFARNLMNHEKVSTFKATDDEDVPPDLYWKPIRTDSQNIFPQSEGSLAEYKHEVSRKYKFKTHGLQEEQDFEGLPRISGLKWAHEDVEELLAEGHQTSHFESNVHHTGIQSESDWGDQTSSNVNIDSQGKTDSSRHLDINEHLFSSNTMAPLNSPSGPQHPRDTKIMNLDPSIVGAVQEHLHEGVSFELGHYHKTRDWKDSCHRTGKYTSTFHLPGMPETPNPVVKMPFAGQEAAHLGDERAFIPTDIFPQFGNQENCFDQPTEFVAEEFSNLIGSQSFPLHHQNMEEENTTHLEDHFNVLNYPKLPNLSRRDRQSDFIQHRIGSQPLGNQDSLRACDKGWKHSKIKRPEIPSQYQHGLDRHQETLIKDGETQKPYFNLKDMVVQKKRKISNGLQSSAQADQISHTQSKEDAATMVSEYTISEKSPRSVTNTNPHPTLLPSRRLDRSDKLVSSCHLERNPGFGEDRVVKDNIQDINDVTSVKQKPSRRVKLNEAGNIYRKQVRSLFDFSMEKYVAPFMIEFEGFLETELNLEGKKIIFQKTFKDRLSLLTHEFLLLLSKATLTYDPDKESLNVTLAEGYKWMKNVWKSVSIDEISFNYHAKYKANKPDKLHTWITSPEDFIISRIGSHSLLNRNQIQPIAFVVLTWMKKFRPLWYDSLKTKARGKFKELTVYVVHHQAIQCLLQQIETKVNDLEAKIHSY